MSVLDKFISLGFSVSTPDSKIIDCRESIKELIAERDALEAAVAVLREYIERGSPVNFNPEKCERRKLLARTPQQHLAEIKAEAGRAGFIEGVRQMCDNEIGMFGHDAESCANHYAAIARLGFEPGTWLKDSNVNSGKRQGGEK